MNDMNSSKAAFAEFIAGFFSPIQRELDDPEVSEVMLNGAGRTFVERGGCIQESTGRFSSPAELLACLRAVAQYLGHPFDETHPILEGRLPDGSRLQAVLAPVALDGPVVAIRRHRQDTVTLEQLVAWGALNEAAVSLLGAATRAKQNIIVAGGTGSGKTSLLRCLAGLIPQAERIVTIEDARELHLRHPHVVSLEARPADARGKGALSIGELFRATLRLRPDRIVIGELRSGEALDLIQAMTSGHGGCLSTLHASSPGDALRRIETLALYQGLDLPLLALRAQVASAIDWIVQVERCDGGRRWVSAISQVLSMNEAGRYLLVDRLRRDAQGELVAKAEDEAYVG